MNLPIFKALGNLTACIPPPTSSPWTSEFYTPRHVGAGFSRLGRILGEKWPSKISENIEISLVFKAFLRPRPAQHPTKWPPKSPCSSQNGVRKMVLHIKAILDRLGLDFGGSWGRCCAFGAPSWLQLGAQERSRAAQERQRVAQDRARAVQEPTKTPRSSPGPAEDSPRRRPELQEPPKTAQELPKSRPRCPGAAQDLPRSCPGPPRSAPDPMPYPRLDKNSQLHHAIPQSFCPNHKAAEIKNERRRYSPQGGLQYSYI